MKEKQEERERERDREREREGEGEREIERERETEREREGDTYIYFFFYLFIYYLICCPETEPDPTLALSEIPDAAPLLPFHGLLDILRSPLPVRLLFRLPLLLGRKVRNGVLGVLVPEVRPQLGAPPSVHGVVLVAVRPRKVRRCLAPRWARGGRVRLVVHRVRGGRRRLVRGGRPRLFLGGRGRLVRGVTKPLSGPWGVGGALGTVQAGGGGGKDPKVPCPGP